MGSMGDGRSCRASSHSREAVSLIPDTADSTVMALRSTSIVRCVLLARAESIRIFRTVLAQKHRV